MSVVQKGGDIPFKVPFLDFRKEKGAITTQELAYTEEESNFCSCHLIRIVLHFEMPQLYLLSSSISWTSRGLKISGHKQEQLSTGEQCEPASRKETIKGNYINDCVDVSIPIINFDMQMLECFSTATPFKKR